MKPDGHLQVKLPTVFTQVVPVTQTLGTAIHSLVSRQLGRAGASLVIPVDTNHANYGSNGRHAQNHKTNRQTNTNTISVMVKLYDNL